MKEGAGHYPRLSVDVDAGPAVSQAPAALVTSTVRAAGPDLALCEALGPWCPAQAVYGPAEVLLDVAMTLALGGDRCSDPAVLRAERAVFGPVASDPRLSRLLARLTGDVDRVLSAINTARACARARVWAVAGANATEHARDDAHPLVIDIDATWVTAHSKKESAGVSDDHSMTVTALVIAILALVVAGLSALYARQQATATAETAARDKERRHDELTPHFTAVLEPMANSQPYFRLRLQLDTPQPLGTLSVRLLGAPVDVQFSSGQLGVDRDARPPIHEASVVSTDDVALRPYDHATWQVELNSRPEVGLRLQVDAEARGDVWRVPVSVLIPQEPYVW